MKKDYLKYILAFVISSMSFMIIDDVYALSTFPVYIPDHGVATQQIFDPDHGMILFNNFNTSSKSLGGTNFSYARVPNVDSYYGYNYQYRFFWKLNSNYYKNFNSVSFMVGYHPGYVNLMRFALTDDYGYHSGWSSCTPVSLPGSTGDHSTQFSSFSCDFNPDTLQDDHIYMLNVIAYSISSSYSSGADAPTISHDPAFYFSTDAMFYKSSDQEITDYIKRQTESMNKTSQTLDEIKDADLNDSDKELPDTSKFDEYESAEGELLDKVGEADTSSLSIGMDANSSNFVWTTLTDLIQSHSVVFGMFISILSIGIIKLALGR